MKTLVLTIEGMHCEGCAETIKALLKVEAGVKASTVSFKEGDARVLYDPAVIDEAKIATVIERAGYKIVAAGR